MSSAVGMIEVYGLVAAFAACDAGCKAANVTVKANCFPKTVAEKIMKDFTK